jgi:hypothetical protein
VSLERGWIWRRGVEDMTGISPFALFSCVGDYDGDDGGGGMGEVRCMVILEPEVYPLRLRAFDKYGTVRVRCRAESEGAVGERDRGDECGWCLLGTRDGDYGTESLELYECKRFDIDEAELQADRFKSGIGITYRLLSIELLPTHRWRRNKCACIYM